MVVGGILPQPLDEVEIAAVKELVVVLGEIGLAGADAVRFVWEAAYDFDNQPITYRLRVAATPDMANPVVDVAGLDSTEYGVPAAQLAAGTWYYEVTATTQDGRTAPAMNKIQINDVYYPGVDRTEVTG